jgi:hypothetical protein
MITPLVTPLVTPLEQTLQKQKEIEEKYSVENTTSSIHQLLNNFVSELENDKNKEVCETIRDTIINSGNINERYIFIFRIDDLRMFYEPYKISVRCKKFLQIKYSVMNKQLMEVCDLLENSRVKHTYEHQFSNDILKGFELILKDGNLFIQLMKPHPSRKKECILL